MSTSVPEKPLLTPRETAEWMKVSTRTLRRLVERGEVPALRVGRQVRFDPAELASYVYGPPRR